MYTTPTTEDLESNLAELARKTKERAGTEHARIVSKFAANGAANSTMAIQSVLSRYDELHAEALQEAMRLVAAYAERGAGTPPSLGRTCAPIFSALGDELLARIHGGSLQQFADKAKQEYAARFRQRLDGALRDLEIGFVGGQNVATMKDSDRRAIVLQKFYDQRHIRSWVALPVDPGASTEERLIAANICNQLAQSGLIEWKKPGSGGPDGMGRITAPGIDVVEGTRQPPIAISIAKVVSVQGSSHVQIGDGNTQGVTIDAERIVAAINQSSATEIAKQEAKSKLKAFLENPLVRTILGKVLGADSQERR